MKIVAINGSARKDWNTAMLARHVLRELEKRGFETELIQLAGKKIQGCIACRKCFENKNKRCSMDDDVVNECIGKMLGAEGILLASPVYFSDLSAGMKALIERAGYVARANNEMFRRKVGAAVVAARRSGSMHTLDSMNHFFLVTQMVIPGSTYWNMGFGLEKGDVEKDEDAIKNMSVLGENMAWLIKKIHG